MQQHYFSSFSVHISRLGLESKTHPPEKFSISLNSHTCSKLVKLQFVVQRAPPPQPSPKKKIWNRACSRSWRTRYALFIVILIIVSLIDRWNVSTDTPGKRLCLENLIIKKIYITSKRNNIGPTLAIVKVRSFLLRYVEKKYLERPRRSLPVLSITNRDNVN